MSCAHTWIVPITLTGLSPGCQVGTSFAFWTTSIFCVIAWISCGKHSSNNPHTIPATAGWPKPRRIHSLTFFMPNSHHNLQDLGEWLSPQATSSVDQFATCIFMFLFCCSSGVAPLLPTLRSTSLLFLPCSLFRDGPLVVASGSLTHRRRSVFSN